MTPLEKFQELLRELFQLKDAAELDFGIYRILNLKRVQVEEFIASRLPAIVAEAFTEYTTADMAELQKQLSKLRAEYVALAGEAAFESGGGLRADLRSSERGKEYSELHSRLKSAVATEELKTRVYNDLYSFFSRYYDDGDFITRRRIRYSGNDAYAIPYNGDEVVLHWATKDQYYVKTIDRFTNYRFRAGDYSVVFEVKRADAEEDNGRDKRRYYALAGQDPVAWDAATKTLRVYFEYRPLSGKEQTTYGRTEQQKPQDKLNDEAAQAILGAIPDAAPKADLARSDKADSEDSVLTRHLRRFTRRNSSDFFIHKNLRGFLEQELDYFIKAECVLLDEVLNAADLKLSQAHVLRARVVRRIGGHIIDFLAQVEDFQKKLFEKRKFVLRTEYCLTLDRVPETFWPEILASEAQLAEWRDLFGLGDLLKQAKKRKPDVAFLKTYPTLVMDTKHFSEDFKWRLLASFDNLDDAMDGVLVKSENFQAINLLTETYRGRVRCIHIDPPYNTQTSGFLYKNNYQHSSWLAMMRDRIAVSIPLLAPEGAFVCHIDENEYEALFMLCSQMGIPDAGTVVWDKRNPMLGRVGVATQHEYILWRTWSANSVYLRAENVKRILAKASELIQQHGGVTDPARREFAEWAAKCDGLTGGERQYHFIDDDGVVYRGVAMGAPERRTDPKFHIPLIHPITKRQCGVPPNGWSRSPETLQKLIQRGEILFGPDETVGPQRKLPLTADSRRQLSSVIRNAGRGKTDLIKLGLDFPYCHPVSLYEELVGAATQDGNEVVIDYFAGSGTNGHSVINLNRDDGGRRKYVLADIDGSFDSVLVPRIKKVVFSADWADGKPVSNIGVSHSMMYSVTEQYEDALGSLEVRSDAGAQKTLNLQGDEYLLKYMLDTETRGSASLLNVEMFKEPFSYKLKVQDGNGTRESAVDLVQTFNYLLGLDVRKLRQFEDEGRVYRAVLGDKRGKSVVVVWRSVKDIEENKDALLQDKVFIEKTILPALLADGAKPDRLFVNAASFVEGAEAIEPEFKRLMFAPIA
jgi:adenine-specific DNA-methyltransferase